MGRITGVLIALALGTALVLPSAAHATFPGSNGRIAFAQGGDIWTMEPDGSDQVNLTNDAASQSAPAWSADGNRIAFTQLDPSPRVWHMNADGTDRVLADDGQGVIRVRREPTWSPNGARIAFTNGAALFTMNPNGSGVFPVAYTNQDPDWSPAGDLISHEPEGGSSSCHFHGLRTVRTDGTNETVLVATDPGCDYDVMGNSWSPDAQRIVYWREGLFCPPACVDIGLFTIRPDGTDRQPVPGGGPAPAWSPDSTKFAFNDGNGQVRTMNTDGTGVSAPLATGLQPDWQPLPASSGADVLANLDDSPDPAKGGDQLHYTASAKNIVGPDTATGVTLTLTLPSSVFYVSATPTQGSCSQAAGVVTCNFGTLAQGATASVDVMVEVRNRATQNTITATATVSANEPDPVPGNNTASESTQASFGGYPRAKSATPTLVPLVIAYKACGPGEDTLQHAPPLTFPSCANPQQTSGHLTAGTGDSNARPANFVGSVRLSVLGEPVPQDPNNGDQSDVAVDVSLADVRNKSDLSDYAGAVRMETALQITDQDSGVGQFTSATGPVLTLQFTAPCAATPDPNIGSACAVATTYEAIVPGAVKEFKKSIWELGRVRVIDGGADGDPATGPNTVFATQGIFAP